MKHKFSFLLKIVQTAQKIKQHISISLNRICSVPALANDVLIEFLIEQLCFLLEISQQKK